MKEFTLHLSNGSTMKGNSWEVKNGKANFCLITGMQEYAARYDSLAKYLNEHGVNVYVLDHIGQGLNSPKVEDQMKWPEGAFESGVEGIHLMIEMAKKNGLPTVQAGHSMGSFFTQRRLQRYPDDTEKTILIGSNGGQSGLMKIAFAMACLGVHKGNWDKKSKVLTSLGTGAYGKAIPDAKTPIDWLSVDEENVRAYLADPYCGYPPTCGFWKEFLRGMSKLWDKKAMACVSPSSKILILSGDHDPVGQMGKGPRWLEKTYKELGVKDVRCHLYEGKRHEIHNDFGKEIVYADLLSFILE